MPLEIGLWRVDGTPQRLSSTAVPLESELEALIEGDPAIVGTPLLFIGRQVPTAHGKYIDLLAIDGDGVLHVLELKRDRTPRDVVAQALDYGSWVETLEHDDVLGIFETYRQDVAFETAFSDRFGSSPPEELNTGHRLTIVASDVDPATARIVEYLARFDVPVNVMFFRYFTDDGRAFLARTWLVEEGGASTGKKQPGGGSKEPWNGQDWYVSFGEDSGIRSWDDARTHGFVSAGGGAWYSRTLRSLPVGARVFVCIPGTGYVGVGTVTGEAAPFEDARLPAGDHIVPMTSLHLKGTYTHPNAGSDGQEYVVPVSWIDTRPREAAIWEKGFFANQNSACKLRNRFTLEGLTAKFHLEDS